LESSLWSRGWFTRRHSLVSIGEAGGDERGSERGSKAEKAHGTKSVPWLPPLVVPGNAGTKS